MSPGGGGPLLLRPNTVRWSEDPLPGDPYDALVAEIGAARETGWFVTGAYCWNSSGFHGYGRASETSDPDPSFSVDRIMVGFAKPSGDLDHAQAGFLFEELHSKFDPSSSGYVPKGRIVVSGVAPHHADQGWPKYVPVELSDTCIADPHHPRLPTSDEEPPKTNPPPPEEESSHGPLDQAGKPFAKWDDSNRFSLWRLRKPVSSTPATPST
ncbi:hypothetical protein [Segniliparus rugosus]|uniref:Uncharacterized protein n=1 Tax=Segniliparus rugosus (strain ATCC BAA-974 / DSM 45345 / CCUG 50838 / CIP 108380 / JCM 13579 / CDC 945) TaxID=679197 RepID=E5XU12_SEGRC|nr:hypothetical protein [Segniliparus rugosus]EFV12181.2 hypothetical protein HMPREF9336_02984 [Segniliparus rugosus ATCC BAA-974]